MLKRFKMHYTTKNVVYRGISNGMFRFAKIYFVLLLKLPFHEKRWRVTSIRNKKAMHQEGFRKYASLAIIFFFQLQFYYYPITK